MLYRNKTSEPFLSGDAFASLADLEIDRDLLQNLKRLEIKISKARIVFCPSKLLEEFARIFPAERPLDILLVGNGDENFTSEGNLISRMARYSFVQNSCISNGSTIFTLPIGIENIRLGVNGLIKFNPEKSRKINGSILVGPFSPTAQCRNQFTNEEFLNNPQFTVLSTRVDLSLYSNYLHSHEFVLCPEGNGIDTHRVWEALYAGSKPVLLSSAWSKSLIGRGFPIVLTASWTANEIENAIQNSSHLKFDPKDISPLWLSYWENLFRELVHS
jgi:hypothetical protein